MSDNSRIPVSLPALRQAFWGENNRDGLTAQCFQAGHMARVRNYEFIGDRKIRKRYGHRPWIVAPINGAHAVQGLYQYRSGSTRYLVGISQGTIKYDNAGSWSAISGVTPASGDNVLTRFCRFHDGTNRMIVGSDGTLAWYWPGTGAAVQLTEVGAAQDVQPFMHHLFAIGTTSGDYVVQHTDAGSATAWPADNVIDLYRSSKGRALSPHNRGTLLVFYEDAWGKIQFRTGTGAIASYFTGEMVEEGIGTPAKCSVCPYRGATYFANDEGVFRITSPSQPAEYISGPIETFWSGLNDSRIPYITAIPRYRPYHGNLFLVSYGASTQHDHVLFYDPERAAGDPKMRGWAIFDSPLANKLKYNAGCDVIDSTGRHATFLGDYSGVASEAFGYPERSTGSLDGGTSGDPVQTLLRSGYLHCGYPDRMKGFREFWMSLTSNEQLDFSIQILGANDESAFDTVAQLAAAGAFIDDDFMVDESYVVGGGLAEEVIEMKGQSRYLEVQIAESNTGTPFPLDELWLLFVHQGKRMK